MKEARASSIAKGCPGKTEHRSVLSFVGVLRGGVRLHASVAGSRKSIPLSSSALETSFYGHASYILTLSYADYNIMRMKER